MYTLLPVQSPCPAQPLLTAQLDPDAAEDFITYLISIGRYDDAAAMLVDVVNRDKFSSKTGKTNHQVRPPVVYLMPGCDLLLLASCGSPNLSSLVPGCFCSFLRSRYPGPLPPLSLSSPSPFPEQDLHSTRPHHQLWVELCQLIAKNPDQVSSIKVRMG